MKRLHACLLLLTILVIPGCLTIEKRTLTLVIPPDSNEVLLYYTFEGMSVLKNWSTTDEAEKEIERLQEESFSFLLPSGLSMDSDDSDTAKSLIDYCRFEDLEFFKDNQRARKLCAQRKMTITDRQKFAETFNKNISEGVSEYLAEFCTPDFDFEAYRQQVKLQQKQIESFQKMADQQNMGLPVRIVAGIFDLADQLDLESMNRILAASNNDFQWIRFEPYTLKLVIPTSPESAKQIVNAPDSKTWLETMQTMVAPIDLLECEEGLAIVVGKQGGAIRFTYNDKRVHEKKLESKLAECANNPDSIKLNNGQEASAESLIDQFITENLGKHILRDWKNSEGQHTMAARFHSRRGDIVVLVSEEGEPSALYFSELSKTDQDWVKTATGKAND